MIDQFTAFMSVVLVGVGVISLVLSYIVPSSLLFCYGIFAILSGVAGYLTFREKE